MSLTDTQITELCRRMNIPLASNKGIAFKTEFSPSDLEYNKAYFVNLQDEYDDNGSLNSGSHWTTFTIRKYENGEIDPIYFDSYGIGPPEEIKECIMKFCKKKVPFTKKDIQSLMSNACGWFCCAYQHFIWNFSHRTGDVYEDTELFLECFDDLNKSTDWLKNEFMLKQFFQPKDASLRRPIRTAMDINPEEITNDVNGPVVSPFK